MGRKGEWVIPSTAQEKSRRWKYTSVINVKMLRAQDKGSRALFTNLFFFFLVYKAFTVPPLYARNLQGI